MSSFFLYVLLSWLSAVLIGYFLIKGLMCGMRKEAEKDLDQKIEKLKGMVEKEIDEDKKKLLSEELYHKEKERRYLWASPYEEEMSKWTGFFERTLYILIWLTGHLELIAAWLVVKVVGSWGNRDSGRVDRFLIGTGLSVLIGSIAGWYIKNYLLPFLARPRRVGREAENSLIFPLRVRF
jgi:hypothetical protein